MNYHMDYAEVTLEEYREKLIGADLVPSRMILKENTDEIFQKLQDHGINNVAQLLQHLKNKKRLQNLFLSSQIDEQYLIILSREIRSNLPKPVRLKDFPGISQNVIDKLEAIGIKNTKQFWEKALNMEDRNMLAEESSLPVALISQLAQMSDLCRVRWVNHTFAHILMLAGVNSVQNLIEQDYKALHLNVVDLNKIHRWYKGNIGQNDFKLVIAAARELTIELR